MAPACPFITEHLYQNLKKLRPAHATDGSIHFQMIPEVDESLINLDIEDAVANMTNVIKLGRTIRDQKVQNKEGCVFPMVIGSESRMEKFRDDDHREDASHFN